MLSDDGDEIYEEIEELGTIVSFLREPNSNIKREFAKVKRRKPSQLQHLLKTILKELMLHICLRSASFSMFFRMARVCFVIHYQIFRQYKIYAEI